MKLGLLGTAAWFALAAPAVAAPSYTLTKSVALGAPDRWDYVIFDAPSQRVYVAHADRLTVVDAQTGAVVGEVAGITGGTHGTAISHATQQGYTDDGKNGQAVIFDLATLKVTKRIAADLDADAIAVDLKSGHVFVMDGDPGVVSVIDPRSDSVVASIKTGEKLEYAAADGAGSLFVAGEEKRDVVKIDTRTNMIVSRWAVPDCDNPHGLALDVAGHRLFLGCVNSLMMVVDTRTGATMAKLAIGRGSDAVAFDPKRRRVFSSNGVDGTISVFQQNLDGSYLALDPVVTTVSGRTMAVDPVSGRLFVAAADTDPPAAPGARAKVKPGTLKLLMLDPS